jgi:predicted tellurium resistance membrane protein TerC
MIELLTNPLFWTSIAAIIAMELALGIDNALFISLIASKLPPEAQARIRQIAFAIAAVFRVLLALAIAWIISVQQPLFTLGDWAPGWRELVYLAGGIFLLYKAAFELFAIVEMPAERTRADMAAGDGVAAMIVQIVLLNAVFSVDSVIVALGLGFSVEAMIAGLLIGIGLLYAFGDRIGTIIRQHPSLRVMALAFLLLVGATLVVESFGLTLDRVALYAAMGLVALIATANVFTRPSDSPVPLSVLPVVPDIAPTAAPSDVPIADLESLEPSIPDVEPEREPEFVPTIERAEPRFDPEPDVVVTPVEPEPVTANVTMAEPVFEPIPDEPVVDDVLIEDEISDENEPIDEQTDLDIEQTTIQPSLGEPVADMPKARPKRNPRLGRPIRRRTGARKG